MIDELASHYGIEAISIATASDNVVRVRTGQGELALKTFPIGERDRAAREADLLAYLGESAAYRVPIPIRTRDGATWSAMDDGALVVMRWCAGAKKTYTTITAPEWYALGNTLAALHGRLDDAPVALPRAPAIELGVERAAMLVARERARAKDPDRGAAIARYLDARIAMLDARGERGLVPPPGPERPIHNDYNQHNYLFDGALPPIIIDWEAAIVALREFEVVRCLNHLPIVAPAHARAFVDGYRARRPLEREALRWAIDRSLLEHAVKSWPIDRWLADLPGAEASLAGSMEVFAALETGTAQLLAFFGVSA